MNEKNEVHDDVGDGLRELALPSDEAVHEFFDWDAEGKTGHEREATAINSNITYSLSRCTRYLLYR